MIFLASRTAIIGVTFLALSIMGVLFLISDVLFIGPSPAIAAARAAALIACLWFVLPLSRSGEPEPRPAAFSHPCSRPLRVLGVCTVRRCIAALLARRRRVARQQT
jgi:hypothetical protein